MPIEHDKLEKSSLKSEEVTHLLVSSQPHSTLMFQFLAERILLVNKGYFLKLFKKFKK